MVIKHFSLLAWLICLTWKLKVLDDEPDCFSNPDKTLNNNLYLVDSEDNDDDATLLFSQIEKRRNQVSSTPLPKKPLYRNSSDDKALGKIYSL